MKHLKIKSDGCIISDAAINFVYSMIELNINYGSLLFDIVPGGNSPIGNCFCDIFLRLKDEIDSIRIEFLCLHAPENIDCGLAINTMYNYCRNTSIMCR